MRFCMCVKKGLQWTSRYSFLKKKNTLEVNKFFPLLTLKGVKGFSWN